MKRVVGIGGIFLKAKDPKALQAWYVKHLGLPQNSDGYIIFEGRDGQSGQSVWSAFPEDTTYYEPSTKAFMYNFRVDDLEALLRVLQEEGVTIIGEMQVESYGKFGWVMDPEGNKIELWEPTASL